MIFAGAIGVALRPMGIALRCTGGSGFSLRISAGCTGTLAGTLSTPSSDEALGLPLLLVLAPARFALLISRIIAGTSSALFALKCTTVTDVET